MVALTIVLSIISAVLAMLLFGSFLVIKDLKELNNDLSRDISKKNNKIVDIQMENKELKEKLEKKTKKPTATKTTAKKTTTRKTTTKKKEVKK